MPRFDNVPRQEFVAVMTYGWIGKGGSGEEGSKHRVNTAIQYIKSGRISSKDLIVIFPQGYNKKNPRTPENGQTMSLGENVGEYFKASLNMKEVRVITDPRSWGTENDIEEIFYISYCMCDLGRIGKVHFFSDPDHLERVAQIATHKLKQFRSNIEMLHEWELAFHPVYDHKLTWKERNIREPVASLSYWLKSSLR